MFLFQPLVPAAELLAGGVATGSIKVWTGAAWELKPVKYWTGSAWVVKPVKYWTGAAWNLAP